MKYPVYVISKGRSDCCYTANFLIEDGVEFKIVIEQSDYEKYRERYSEDKLLVLPFKSFENGSIPARNWVWEHAKRSGTKRHWILDDNIRMVRRMYRGVRIRCNSGVAFEEIEEFTDRYENIAISGMNYTMFVLPITKIPYNLNVHVYSCLLIDNVLDIRWRGRYNEDTDLCLQVLSKGLCTVLFNAFTVYKMKTMTMKGGNMESLYKGDGRLKMAKSLESQWPGVVKTIRRWKRPQHYIVSGWRHFDTPLIRRKDINWNEIESRIPQIQLKELCKDHSKRIERLLNNDKD